MIHDSLSPPLKVARVRVVVGGATAIVLAAVVVGAVSQAHRANSATWDETLYLHLGREAIVGRGMAAFAELGVAPLPVRLAWTEDALQPVAAAAGDPTVYRERVERARRNAMWWFAVPLISTVVLWVSITRGVIVGAVAGALIALSPNVLAHASLATTDVAFTLAFVLTIAILVQYIQQRTLLVAGALALALGVSLATKYSAIGLYLVTLIACAWRRRPGSLRGDAGVIVLGITIAWALHGFAVEPLVARTGWATSLIAQVAGSKAGDLLASIAAPSMFRGIAAQMFLERQGQEGYLLGQVSPDGWWYFFPVALALKSTPAELVAVLAFACLAFHRRMRDAETQVIVLAVLVFGGLALMGRRALGVRYVLPLVVLVVVAAVAWSADWLSRRRLASAIVGGAAITAQALTWWSIAPQHLAYFNDLAGGPEQGYTRLVDSNLDWGQDLIRLSRWMDDTGTEQVGLAYFGTAPPAAYDARIKPWRALEHSEPSDRAVIVISATYLQGVFLCGDPFAGFRGFPPSARIGYSLMAYALDRTEVRGAMRQSAADRCAP